MITLWASLTHFCFFKCFAGVIVSYTNQAYTDQSLLFISRREQSGALFKVDELARLYSDGKTDYTSLITSTAFSSSGIALALFNEVFIFDGEQLNVVSSFSFESNVDTMAWSPDSQFVVICDSSGTMYLYSLFHGNVVFTTALVEMPKEELNVSSYFVHSIFTCNQESKGIDLMIVSKDGCVFSFKNLPLRELSNGFELNDVASISKLEENIQMEILKVSDLHGKTSCCVESAIAAKVSLVVSGTGNYSFSIWRNQNLVDAIELIFNDGVGVKKCDVSPDGKYLLILDENSVLSIWDTNALIMLSAPCHAIKDFVLTSGAATIDGGATAADAGQVVTLTETADGKSKIEIYQLPRFQEVYSKEVAESCVLASSDLQDKVYYTEECVIKDSNKNIQGLALKCLSEASPEHRVYSLVRKKRFSAALEFSKAFNLDVEFVYKAKASTILADISRRISESDTVTANAVLSVDQVVNNLEETLQNIRSIEFSVECCLSASPPELQQVRRLLCFANDKIRNVSGKEKDKYSKEMNDVLFSIHRLDTFQMVFGDSKFSGSKWHQFCTGSMLGKVTQALSEGNLSSAGIIWLRHNTEFEKEFSLEKLQRLLASVRSDLPSSSVILWLKSYLVPFIICVNDREALYALASWLEQRVVSLEIAEKEEWPNNGLDLASILFDVVSDYNEENSDYINFPTPIVVSQDYGSALVKVSARDNDANPVSSLARMIEHLTELKKLHVNYHCKLPLAEFTKETPLGIMFKMLDCVLAVTLIPSVINNQITQYGLQHGFQIDDVLLEYIACKTKLVRTSSSNALYEDRFVEIIRCVKTRSKLLEAILMLMSWASVPWSSTIETMVNKAMLANPYNSSLKMSYKFMEMKKILSHYGIRDFEPSSDLHLKMVVKNVLGTLHKTALQDALRMVETYDCMSEEDIYIIRIRNLCLKGLPHECTQVLVGVDDSKVVYVAQCFLTWVVLVVDVYEDNEDDRSERRFVLEAGVCMLGFLQNIGKITEDSEVTLNNLKSILALDKEFSIFVTYGDYRDMNIRNEVLSAYFKKNSTPLSKLIKLDEGKLHDLDKLLRLGSLLGLSAVQLQTKLFLQKIAGPPNNLNLSTFMILNEWLEQRVHELSSNDIFSLSIALMQQQVSENAVILSLHEFNVPQMIHRLACCCASTGEAGNISDLIDLCKVCWLAEMLYSSCESGDLNLSTAACQEDGLLLWNNASRFRDNGFVLNVDTAFSLYNSFAKSIFLVTINPEEHLENLTVACRNLVFYLEENNLHELALQFVLYSLSHLLVYSSLDEAAQKENLDVEQNRSMAMVDQLAAHGVHHVSSMLLNLATKVLRGNEIDHNLALGYLCSLPEDAALQKLKSDFAVDEGHDASQAIASLHVLLCFAKRYCNAKIVNAVEELYSDALWYTKLLNLGIACENLLIGETKEVKKVLELLLEKPGVDVTVVIDFCKSFSLDIELTLCTYIKLNLAGNRTNSADACDQPVSCGPLASSSVKHFKENFVPAVDYLFNHSNTTEVLTLMKDVLLSLPFYDYERLSVVLNQIIKLSGGEDREVFERQLEVLNMLETYTRTASPSEYEERFQVNELNFDVKEHSEHNRSLAEKRLPFHPLFHGKPWKIVAPELNDETIMKLLPVCKRLKMQEDQMYVAAANNLISCCSLEQSSDEGMAGSALSANIYFEKAADLLSAVKNPAVAAKTGLTLLSRWPQCEERLKNANDLVALVMQWRSNCEGEESHVAEKILKTSKDVYQEIAIQHILHSNGVKDEGSFNLKRKPVKLIFHLYETYGCVPDEKRPNVHKIVDEVAAISDLNIAKIRNRLLTEWQPLSSRGMRSLENSSVEKRTNEQKNVKRVLYLMEADSLQKNARFLLNFAYRQGPSKITYESRVRAIKLLFNIASHEVIESVANCSIDDLKQYMKSLVYLSELEHLHLNQTVESFQRCNKEGLVKGLWKNHKDNAHAILLIADICLDWKISEPHIWTNILRQLSNLGLTTYLSNLLPRLSQFPNLWLSSNLIKIWTVLVVQFLQKGVFPIAPEERNSCERTMQLLQKCPIMQEPVTLRVFEKLLEVGMYSYAIACLTLVNPHEMLSSRLTNLLSVVPPVEILDLIAKEHATGQCFVNPDVSQALVFDFLDASGSYESLENSAHHLKFANYLINKKKFTRMVMATIKRGDLNAAVELARHYDAHGSPLKMSGSHLNPKPSVSGFNYLLAFLKKFEILEEVIPYLPVVDTLAVADDTPELDSVDFNVLDDVDFVDVF